MEHKPTDMKTSLSLRTPALITSLLLAVLLLCCARPAAAPGPGFTTAFISKATLNEMANGAGAAGVRVYNARRSANDLAGTVVSIGVQALKGTELGGAATDSRYAMYDKLGATFVVEPRLTRSLAQSAVRFIDPAKDLRFCVDVPKASVNSLIATVGCNAVRVEPVAQGSGFTMRFTPVQVVNGTAQSIPGAVSFTATEPCPTACGPMTNYLW